RRGPFNRLIGQALRITDWSTTDRCLLADGGVLPFTIAYTGFWLYLLRHPEAAPYINGALLPIALSVSVGFLAAWLGSAAVPLWLRHRFPDAAVLMHANAQLAAVTIAWVSYLQGHLTSLFLGAASAGGAIISFVLLGRLPVLYGLVTLVLCLAATSTAVGL